MNNVNFYKWKSSWLLSIILLLLSAKIFAQPPAPDLEVVLPMFGSPLGMYLKWTRVAGAQEYQYRKKVNNGNYGEWKNDCRSFHAFQDLDVSLGATYTYQVRAIVNNIESDPSAPRSNSFIKVWPVTKSSDCTAGESLNLLHGFNQTIFVPGVLGSPKYLHQGIDITGEQNLDRECVRAPIGGIVSRIKLIDPDTGKLNNGSVYLSVRSDNNFYGVSLGHLEGINNNLVQNTSIEAGTYLGYITSSHFNKTEDNHVHIGFDFMMNLKNPLEVWDRNQEQYRDPQRLPPKVEETNSDSHFVRFRKGPNETTYLNDNGNVYGPVDIVVEARDHQSSYKNGPWQNPLKIGYYIKNEQGDNVVRSPHEPYLLIDGSNWFGDLTLGGHHQTSSARIETLFDTDDTVECNFPEPPPGWRQWFTYIVTNTIGTEGTPETLDADQCWATDAHKNEQSPERPNGYRAGYETATTNTDALFPDGAYQIGIRVEDYVHTYAEGNVTDHMEPVVVDNFAPYVEKVIVTTAEGEKVYEAGWEIAGDGTPLIFSPNTHAGSPAPGDTLSVRVYASETMTSMSVTLGDTTTTLDTDDGQQMIWQGEIAAPEAESAILTIHGKDTAENPVLDFSDTTDKTLPQHDDTGAWSCPNDGDSQPACAMPSGEGDTVHQLVFGASTRSYIRKVTVSAGGDPIYSAGWMSLPSEEEEEEEEESSDEEETEQIVFLYYVEPQDPAAGAEAQIEIHSSEAMEDLSVRVAGEPDVDLDPCEASEDGTCWQGALTLPDTENSQLIIQGSDTAGQPLLPFADTTTKTLSEWAEEFDESGDTAHALGALPDPAWQLETPEESICSETERGVTCLFGGDDNGEGQGVVFLHPAEDGTELAAVLDEHDEAGASHSGVVWGSPSGLVLEIQPPRDDLELCEAHDDITTRCPHSWDYDPEEDAPPESEVHETELTWTLDATRQTEHCDLTVSWVVEGAEQAVTLAIEPASLCDAFVSEQKELPVTGSCAWTFEGGNYDWLKEELPPETSGPGASPVVSEYIDCQEYHSLRFGGSVSRGGCRENPLWETPPSWTYDVIEPGEPGFQREQTISVSYSGCQEWDDWLSKGDFRQTWPYDMVDLENGDEWVYQQKGRFPSSCLVEIVTVLWNPVGDCRYRYTPDSQSLEFPDGGIAVPLSGNQ